MKDKVVVVTGSTRGIGEGIARVLAKEGARITTSGRDAHQGEALARELNSNGAEALFVRADIACPEDCARLIDASVERFGRIDGLINNAGIFPHFTLMDTTPQDIDTLLATNVKGPFFTTQRALRYMAAQKSGSIVNIGSTHWDLGDKALSAYAMSKGALHTLTQHVAHHFAPQQVRCNWVTVGWVMTPGEQKRLEEEGQDPLSIDEQVRAAVPMGHLQKSEDIAYACVYLLSDEASQVTGTDIKPNGGFHLP